MVVKLGRRKRTRFKGSYQGLDFFLSAIEGGFEGHVYFSYEGLLDGRGVGPCLLLKWLAIDGIAPHHLKTTTLIQACYATSTFTVGSQSRLGHAGGFLGL